MTCDLIAVLNSRLSTYWTKDGRVWDISLVPFSIPLFVKIVSQSYLLTVIFFLVDQPPTLTTQWFSRCQVVYGESPLPVTRLDISSGPSNSTTTPFVRFWRRSLPWSYSFTFLHLSRHVPRYSWSSDESWPPPRHSRSRIPLNRLWSDLFVGPLSSTFRKVRSDSSYWK